MADETRAQRRATVVRAANRSSGVSDADVGRGRERARRRRLWSLAMFLGGARALFLWYRMLDGRPFNVFALPHIDCSC